MTITVRGKVQGVYFRQSTKEKALELGLSGQVSNERDGSVTIIATGTAEQLTALAAWCQQGPSRAVVTKVETANIEYRRFSGFTIAR